MASPDGATAAAIDRAFAALADGTRRRVVDLLRQGPRRAGELSAALDVSPQALSRHLRVLRGSGLVTDVRTAQDADQRTRIYRLRREPFACVRKWVDRVEAMWVEQLTSFAEHVERRGSGS